MGWIQELVDFVEKFKPVEIIYEYEQGLYFRKGRAIEKRVKLDKNKLEEILADEKRVLQETGGIIPLLFPLGRTKLPAGYRREFLTGFPRHPKRFDGSAITGEELEKIAAEEKKVMEDAGGAFYSIFPIKRPVFPQNYKRTFTLGLPRHPGRFEKSKLLNPGLYFYIPFLEDIVKDSTQERVLNIGNISIPTMDEEPQSKVVIISCNIRYQIMDFERAYTAIDDYEESLKDHTLSILAKHSRGKKYEDWKNSDKIEKIGEEVLREVREIVTKNWGLKIHQVYITDHAASTIHRYAHEGTQLFLPSVNNSQ